METLPCQGCRGLCCGPVAVTKQELIKIKKKVKSMPSKIREELANQNRHFGTCIFYDLENDKCGIYSARPEVCRKFGYFEKMACFRKPEMAVKKDRGPLPEIAGILSIDYKWDYFK